MVGGWQSSGRRWGSLLPPSRGGSLKLGLEPSSDGDSPQDGFVSIQKALDIDAGRRRASLQKDHWLILEGQVLRLPDAFLNEHPGGPGALMRLLGKDCTEEFIASGHSESARAWAMRFKVGMPPPANASQRATAGAPLAVSTDATPEAGEYWLPIALGFISLTSAAFAWSLPALSAAKAR